MYLLIQRNKILEGSESDFLGIVLQERCKPIWESKENSCKPASLTHGWKTWGHLVSCEIWYLQIHKSKPVKRMRVFYAPTLNRIRSKGFKSVEGFSGYVLGKASYFTKNMSYGSQKGSFISLLELIALNCLISKQLTHIF